MPYRYQIAERFAFAFVVLSAVMCSTYIAFETSPDFRSDLQVGKELVVKSGQYSTYACATMPDDPCTQLTAQ
ncbi:hypothetical protein [Paraburkholderia phosphatilytica]|uniref:hypothetical protein n=1 Tax=Paraburkholderia phosphatilytica TaxID=2282883 RepID=UPI000E4FBD82|nr:hypothetical protein [Paraburkholderia phosphatilytica]